MSEFSSVLYNAESDRLLEKIAERSSEWVVDPGWPQWGFHWIWNEFSEANPTAEAVARGVEAEFGEELTGRQRCIAVEAFLSSNASP